MTQTDHYEGWTIYLIWTGVPGASARLMTAFKGLQEMSFPELGHVSEGFEAAAFAYARKHLDRLKSGEDFTERATEGEDWPDTVE